MVHLTYIVILCGYVHHNYILADSDKVERLHLALLGFTILYPLFYEGY